MMIFVRCITYDNDKNSHLFNMKSSDTLLAFKKKVMEHFKVDDNIHMFDDRTEQLLESYNQPLCDCFSDPLPSVTFGEYIKDKTKKKKNTYKIIM